MADNTRSHSVLKIPTVILTDMEICTTSKESNPGSADTKSCVCQVKDYHSNSPSRKESSSSATCQTDPLEIIVPQRTRKHSAPELGRPNLEKWLREQRYYQRSEVHCPRQTDTARYKRSVSTFECPKCDPCLCCSYSCANEFDKYPSSSLIKDLRCVPDRICSSSKYGRLYVPESRDRSHSLSGLGVVHHFKARESKHRNRSVSRRSSSSVVTNPNKRFVPARSSSLGATESFLARGRSGSHPDAVRRYSSVSRQGRDGDLPELSSGSLHRKSLDPEDPVTVAAEKKRNLIVVVFTSFVIMIFSLAVLMITATLNIKQGGEEDAVRKQNEQHQNSLSREGETGGGLFNLSGITPSSLEANPPP